MTDQPRSAAEILARPNENRDPKVTEWLENVARSTQDADFWDAGDLYSIFGT